MVVVSICHIFTFVTILCLYHMMYILQGITDEYFTEHWDLLCKGEMTIYFPLMLSLHVVAKDKQTDYMTHKT